MAAKTLIESNNEHRIMRVLRRAESGEYFKDGEWISDPAEADSFPDAVEAAVTCARYGLTDVELAIRLDAGASDMFCTVIR